MESNQIVQEKEHDPQVSEKANRWLRNAVYRIHQEKPFIYENTYITSINELCLHEMDRLDRIAEDEFLHGLCMKCDGACCKKFSLNIDKERKCRTPRDLRVELKKYGLGFILPVVGGQGGARFYTCMMLNDEGRCSIYEDRPNFCRNFRPMEDALCAYHPQHITGIITSKLLRRKARHKALETGELTSGQYRRLIRPEKRTKLLAPWNKPRITPRLMRLLSSGNPAQKRLAEGILRNTPHLIFNVGGDYKRSDVLLP